MKYLLVALCGCEAQIDLDFNDEPRITVMLVQIISACAKHNTDKAEVERLNQIIADAGDMAAEIRRAQRAEDFAKSDNARLKAALEKYADHANWHYIGETFSPRWIDANDPIRMAEEALKGGAQSTCKWEHDLDRETDVWETSCGDAVVFDEGEPKEHGYKFCHYCGKPIEFVEQEGGEG